MHDNKYKEYLLWEANIKICTEYSHMKQFIHELSSCHNLKFSLYIKYHKERNENFNVMES